MRAVFAEQMAAKCPAPPEYKDWLPNIDLSQPCGQAVSTFLGSLREWSDHGSSTNSTGPPQPNSTLELPVKCVVYP